MFEDFASIISFKNNKLLLDAKELEQIGSLPSSTESSLDSSLGESNSQDSQSSSDSSLENPLNAAKDNASSSESNSSLENPLNLSGTSSSKQKNGNVV